jgi:C1A family cysteine protease
MNEKFLLNLVIISIITSVLLIPTGISTSKNLSNIGLEKIGDPPATFDLRNVDGKNYVTGIRNQGQYGTCWTHGVMASMEGNLLMTGNWEAADETGEPDLSEAHLDWWNGFNTNCNDDDPNGGGLDPHWGGDYRVASSYLIRCEGAIREIDSPYNKIQTPSERNNPDYHHYYPNDIEWYVAGSDLSNINTIKYTLMSDGVIGTAFLSSSQYLKNYGSYYAHYQPPSSSGDPNHAVAICGWDDNKVTPAPEPGAWLCKNSWGDWGPEHGYFWISYYDKCCGQHPEMGAVSFQDVEYEPFKSIYYYDYHGWRDTVTDISEAFNAFTAKQDETITAVSFFTAVNNVDYKIIIYNDFINDELQNDLSTQNGTIDYYGYHTIYLNNTVNIPSQDDFYIYIFLSSGGHPIDRTSDVPVLLGSSNRTIVKSNAQPGESYYKSGSNWYDLYDYDFTNPTWDESANFCIKALAGEYIPNNPDLSCEGDLVWSNVKPGLTLTDNIIIKNVGEPYSLLDWEITEWPSWGEWTFSQISGYNLKPEEGGINIDVSVIAPNVPKQEFSGFLKIINKEKPDDFETITISLKTPKDRVNIFDKLLTHLPSLQTIFLIIQQLKNQ